MRPGTAAAALGDQGVRKPNDKRDREIGKVFRSLLKIIGHGHSKNHGNPRAAKMIQYFDSPIFKCANSASNPQIAH